MKTATVIIQDLFLPFLEKDPGFKAANSKAILWEKIAEDFLDYEIDPKPVYAAIYSLDLDEPEKVIRELPSFYSAFIEELAEHAVLNNLSFASKQHLKGNTLFQERVKFFKKMKYAITSLERERMKKEIPSIFHSISDEFSDEVMLASIKKKGREDLRAKFKTWEREKKNEEFEQVYSKIQFSMESSQSSLKEDVEPYPKTNPKKNKGKVISISWMKYAVAACVIIAAGLFYFDSSQSIFSPGNEMVDVDDVEKTKGTEENFNSSDLAVSFEDLEVLQNEGLGYSQSSIKEVIRMNFIDANERISSLRKILKREEGDKPNIKEELSSLMKRQSKYIFQDQQLTIYREPFDDSVKVIQLGNNQYYLQKGDKFYQLKSYDTPQELIQETDEEVIEELERIIFTNE